MAHKDNWIIRLGSWYLKHPRGEWTKIANEAYGYHYKGGGSGPKALTGALDEAENWRRFYAGRAPVPGDLPPDHTPGGAAPVITVLRRKDATDLGHIGPCIICGRNDVLLYQRSQDGDNAPWRLTHHDDKDGTRCGAGGLVLPDASSQDRWKMAANPTLEYHIHLMAQMDKIRDNVMERWFAFLRGLPLTERHEVVGNFWSLVASRCSVGEAISQAILVPGVHPACDEHPEMPGLVLMAVDAASQPSLDALVEAVNARANLAAEVEAAERKAGLDPNP